jgi:hypothetical protein
MQIKYAILNPLDGSYTFKDTHEDAVTELAARALDVYVNHHCHGSPCSYIEVNEDGSETWHNHEGVVIPNGAEVLEQLKKQAAYLARPYSDLPTVTL